MSASRATSDIRIWVLPRLTMQRPAASMMRRAASSVIWQILRAEASTIGTYGNQGHWPPYRRGRRAQPSDRRHLRDSVAVRTCLDGKDLDVDCTDRRHSTAGLRAG